jgi:hypothetical protein
MLTLSWSIALCKYIPDYLILWKSFHTINKYSFASVSVLAKYLIFSAGYMNL